MSKFRILSIVLLAAVFSCCKPDDKPQPNTCIGLHNESGFQTIQRDSCSSIPPENGIGYDYKHPRFDFTDARFHPDGKEEIIYIWHDYDPWPQKQGLWHMNLCTGEQTNLSVDQLMRNLEWHSNGWITFTRKDKQIWKVKANGDSLTQLTFSGQGYDPHWHPDGTRILYWTSRDGIVSIPADGGEPDSLGIYSRYPVMSPDETKIAVNFSSYEIGYYDFGTGEYVRLASIGPNTSDVIWSRDSKELIWSESDPKRGVYAVSVESKEVRTIRENCDTNIYTLISIKDNGKLLMFSRLTKELLDPGTIWAQGFMTITDKNGENGIDIQFE